MCLDNNTKLFSLLNITDEEKGNREAYFMEAGGLSDDHALKKAIVCMNRHSHMSSEQKIKLETQTSS